MPAFGLDDREVDVLVRYLLTLRLNRFPGKSRETVHGCCRTRTRGRSGDARVRARTVGPRPSITKRSASCTLC